MATSIEFGPAEKQLIKTLQEAVKKGKEQRTAEALRLHRTAHSIEIGAHIKLLDSHVVNGQWEDVIVVATHLLEKLHVSDVSTLPGYLALALAMEQQPEVSHKIALKAIQDFPEEAPSYLAMALLSAQNFRVASAYLWLVVASSAVNFDFKLMLKIAKAQTCNMRTLQNNTKALLCRLTTPESIERINTAVKLAPRAVPTFASIFEAIKKDSTGRLWASEWGPFAHLLLELTPGRNGIPSYPTFVTDVPMLLPPSESAISSPSCSDFERILNPSVFLGIARYLQIYSRFAVMMTSKRMMQWADQPDVWRIAAEILWKPVISQNLPPSFSVCSIGPPLRGYNGIGDELPVHSHLIAKLLLKSTPPTSEFSNPWIYKGLFRRIKVLSELKHVFREELFIHSNNERTPPNAMEIFEDRLSMCFNRILGHSSIHLQTLHVDLITLITDAVLVDTSNNTAQFIVECYLDVILYIVIRAVTMFYSISSSKWRTTAAKELVEMLTTLIIRGGCSTLHEVKDDLRVVFPREHSSPHLLQSIVFDRYNSIGLVAFLRNLRAVSEHTAGLLNVVQFWLGTKHWESIVPAPLVMYAPRNGGFTLLWSEEKAIAHWNSPETPAAAIAHEPSSPGSTSSENAASSSSTQETDTNRQQEHVSNPARTPRWHMILTQTETLLGYPQSNRVDTCVIDGLVFDGKDHSVSGRGFSSYGTPNGSKKERSFEILQKRSRFVYQYQSVILVLKFDDNGEELVLQGVIQTSMINGSYGKEVKTPGSSRPAPGSYYRDPSQTQNFWDSGDADAEEIPFIKTIVTGVSASASAPTLPDEYIIPFKREGGWALVKDMSYIGGSSSTESVTSRDQGEKSPEIRPDVLARPAAHAYDSFLPTWMKQLWNNESNKRLLSTVLHLSTVGFQHASPFLSMASASLKVPLGETPTTQMAVEKIIAHFMLIYHLASEEKKNKDERKLRAAIIWYALLSARVSWAASLLENGVDIAKDIEELKEPKTAFHHLNTWLEYGIQARVIRGDVVQDNPFTSAELAASLRIQQIYAKWYYLLNLTPYECYGQAPSAIQLRAFLMVAQREIANVRSMGLSMTSSFGSIAPAQAAVLMDISQATLNEIMRINEELRVAQQQQQQQQMQQQQVLQQEQQRAGGDRNPITPASAVEHVQSAIKPKYRTRGGFRHRGAGDSDEDDDDDDDDDDSGGSSMSSTTKSLVLGVGVGAGIVALMAVGALAWLFFNPDGAPSSSSGSNEASSSSSLDNAD